MKELKFKTWFPSIKFMSEPWDIDNSVEIFLNSHFDDLYKNYLESAERDPRVFRWDFLKNETKGRVHRQYTGRKDRNRAEIYYGDIIRLGDTDCFYVDFMCGAYLLCWKDVNFIHRDKMLGNYTSREMEIVGNIYENPELVDSSKKDI